MKALRLLAAGQGEGHRGEVFSCAYTPDGAFVLSAGWDGFLRLWEGATGATVTALQAGPKPLSACTVSPDGLHWLSGSMEGLLSIWDPVTHQPKVNFVAHIRPVSAIRFSPDAHTLATASWDRQVVLRSAGKEREGRTLSGHLDIVAGCCFTPDSKQLVSWSHDGSLRLWDAECGRGLHTLQGHKDRVVSASLSPDGRWLVTASRDGVLKLWDMAARAEVGGVRLGELCACFFVPDAGAVITVDARGWVLLLSMPGFEVQAELGSGHKVLCADLAASGTQLALGGEDGRVHLVAVDGMEESALIVTATRTVKQKATVLDRILGKTRSATSFRYTCPNCRAGGELDALPGQPVPCASCRRLLRFQGKSRLLQGV
jgi:WD40 repeat protein